MSSTRAALALAATLALTAFGCASRGPAGEEPLEPVLLGPLSRAEIEAALPEWVAAQVEAEPDAGEALRLAEAPPHSRVTVYLGTWCSDSRRELARFWRALDEGGGEPFLEVGYVGVGREKDEPAELLAGVDLVRVPTFVVEVDGCEVGRVVEESPRGIEVDLAALLAGEASGLITTLEELRRR